MNQIQDVSSDRRNNKLFLLGDGHIPLKHGYLESLLFVLVAPIMGAGISPQFSGIMLGFVFLTGYLYNYPPFNFKDKPIPGLAANMLMGWLAFAAGWTVLDSLNVELLLRSLPYLFFNTALYFLTTLPDMEGDASSHKITFPVKYGFSTTVIVSLICFLIAVLMGVMLNDALLLTVLLLSGYFMIRLLAKKTVSIAIVAIKMGIFFLCLMLSFKFPFFLILIVAVFFLTRFYYRKRFRFDYPNLRGD